MDLPFYRKIENAKRLFTGLNPPDLPSDYFAAIYPGRNYIPGSTIPAISASWQKRPSGILEPAGTPSGLPAPIDLVRVYLTFEDIFEGQIPGLDHLLDQVRRLPALEALIFVSQIMADFRRPGLSQTTIDRFFAEQWFQEPVQTKVKNLLRDPNRVLVAPQLLFVLAKLALIHAGDSLLPGIRKGNPVAAIFLIAQYLGADRDESIPAVLDQAPGSLGREIIANHIFNNPAPDTNTIASFRRRWIQLPEERKDDTRVVDLPEIYKKYLGVSLEDLSIFSIGLWANVIDGNPVVHHSYFSGVGWSKEHTYRVAELISIAIPELRAEVRREAAEKGPDWAISTLERWPVIKTYDDSFLVLDAALLINRVFGWLPVYDIINVLIQKGDDNSRSLKGKIEGCVSHLAEIYVLEVITHIVGGSPFGNRIYSDSELQAAFGGKRQKISDAAIDYGDSWVVIEITTLKMRRDSVAALSDEAVMSDLDNLIKKVIQIDETIKKIRLSEERLTGSKRVGQKRFYPLLITAAGFPVNPITLTLLRQKVKDQRLLDGLDVGPLELADMEDLEVVEALQDEGGPSLKDILHGKSNAGLARSGIRDYVVLELGRKLQRSQRIEDLWTESFSSIFERLRREQTN
ncbi:hypothetical protein [Streptosporangium subroseum]|uniref:hypothetical protein n=1 Tax=Streptosporangium subroseum TaxID=106412 RepID=UPI00308DFC2D|nr:hypothetical protein OHB15_44165 [Streptosporangium subroseum]